MRRITATLAVVGALLFSAGSTWADWDDGAAAYNLGDFATALKEFLPYAESGFTEAELLVGHMYLNGKGVPQNLVDAMKWYRKAAEKGHAVAQAMIGSAYRGGEGVPKDYAESVKWLRKAAGQGVAAAQVNLGVMYADGEGVPKDSVKAYKWFALAKRKGDEYGIMGLNLLKNEGMTSAQIAEGQALADEWWDKHTFQRALEELDSRDAEWWEEHNN
jgi:TPR repeat protein